MPCRARIDAPDALHHIIVRGIERRDIVFIFVFLCLFVSFVCSSKDDNCHGGYSIVTASAADQLCIRLHLHYRCQYSIAFPPRNKSSSLSVAHDHSSTAQQQRLPCRPERGLFCLRGWRLSGYRSIAGIPRQVFSIDRKPTGCTLLSN